MVVTLHMDVAHGSAAHLSPEVQKLFQDLEILTIVTWSMYPMAVLCGRAHFGWISDDAEDLVICILGVISKIGMEGIMIAHFVRCKFQNINSLLPFLLLFAPSLAD